MEAGGGGGGGEGRRKRDLEEVEAQRAACARKRESWCIFYLVKEFVLLSLRAHLSLDLRDWKDMPQNTINHYATPLDIEVDP